jgi:hypothetical protein
MFHLSPYVRQFRPSYAGWGVSIKVVPRVDKLDTLHGRFFASQMFGSPSGNSWKPTLPMLRITVLAQRTSWAENMVAILYQTTTMKMTRTRQ